MAKRKIIKIDEEKCDGCGECIPNCHEGAIQIMNGKARLVSDSACDGLGACVGHCPRGAITIEERAAGEYVENELKMMHDHSGNCPGSRVVDFNKERKERVLSGAVVGNQAESELRQWPVQIALIPPTAPYLKGADILIAADCVPFAYANFHNELLKGKVLLVGCPKLDDIQLYKEKIAEIIKLNTVKSITYAHVEVPCCFGLMPIIKDAIAVSGTAIPFKEIVISIRGERLK